MLRKYLLLGSLIAVLCLSGCSNGSELPGYNAKIHYSSSSMYKNDLMDKILNEKIYKATENTEVSDAAKILFRVEDMNDEARRNLNYSMWRAQYNAVTEIHIHTAKGGLSYSLPFPAFRGGTQSSPISGMAGTNALMYTFNHPFIYTSLSVENQPYEQSAQYLGKPYKELNQDSVTAALQNKWSQLKQDKFDISSIEGSTFKRENIINSRWSTMKTKSDPRFLANDISFALPNEPDTQYVLTLMVREDGEQGIGKRGVEDVIAHYIVPNITSLAWLNESSHFESFNNFNYRVLNDAIEESSGNEYIKIYKNPIGITQTIEVYPVEHKGLIWANLVDIVTINEAQLKARHNMRHGGHTYVWNDGVPGVRVYFAYEDGTSELRFSTQDAHNLYIHTIRYNYDLNRNKLPPLGEMVSDATISNLGDTYKGEVDFL